MSELSGRLRAAALYEDGTYLARRYNVLMADAAARLDELEAENAKLRTYGWHKHSCPVYRWPTGGKLEVPCNCGWEALEQGE